jgi:hypothetical protein
MRQSNPAENLFTRSWMLLCANTAIVIPGTLAGLVAGLAQDVLSPSVFTGSPLGHTIAALIGLFAAVAALTCTTGMAHVAWERGKTTLADGQCAFLDGGNRVLAAVVLLAFTAALATVLAFLTLGLSLLAFTYFSLYTIAAVVVGRRNAVEGFAESAGIASRRVASTIVIIIGFIGSFVIAGLIGFVLMFLPLIGPILAAIIAQTCAAYFAIVIVGEYLTARGTPPSTYLTA